MVVLWIVLGIVGLVILYGVVTYNRLIRLRVRSENSWSQIDVQLRRRYDLIPNLVEAVKGYAENELTRGIRRLIAVAENYPELKASENFLALQEELTGTESKIAFARQFYNDQVAKLNTLIQSFPASIVARMGGFPPREFFEIEEPAARGS